ncbi:hydrogenase maturation nickel metallochaperone HypA [Desulfovibrio legallii]|jgi:hydrogenase nickel incorporation protein HypA/HybF|nr:hydrogenase maturation nickel metallochaperone HypA [Desulfovibrio legallii]
MYIICAEWQDCPDALYLPGALDYHAPMHEMSIAQSLLQMAVEEISHRGCSRLQVVSVACGALSGVVPESLQFCFEILVKDTPHEGARLEITVLPLRLRCSQCGKVFGGEGQDALWEPCPDCGEQFGHVVEQGKELYLDRIEAL